MFSGNPSTLSIKVPWIPRSCSILAQKVPPYLSSCVFIFFWSKRNLFEITRFLQLLSILLNNIIRVFLSLLSLSLHPCTPIIDFSLKANIHRYLDRVMLFDILHLLKILSVKLSVFQRSPRCENYARHWPLSSVPKVKLLIRSFRRWLSWLKGSRSHTSD